MAEEIVEHSSELAIDAAAAWQHATDMGGVNYELMPLVRMSVPRAARGKSLADAPLNEVAFSSWLLAFGLVPFDLHSLKLVEVDPGRRFLERSTSWMQRYWQHERTIEPTPNGCRITDRVIFEPRISLLSKLVRVFVDALFRHRHRRLCTRYGT